MVQIKMEACCAVEGRRCLEYLKSWSSFTDKFSKIVTEPDHEGTQSHSRMMANVGKMFSDDHSVPVLRNKGFPSVPRFIQYSSYVLRMPAS